MSINERSLHQNQTKKLLGPNETVLSGRGERSLVCWNATSYFSHSKSSILKYHLSILVFSKMSLSVLWQREKNNNKIILFIFFLPLIDSVKPCEIQTLNTRMGRSQLTARLTPWGRGRQSEGAMREGINTTDLQCLETKILDVRKGHSWTLTWKYSMYFPCDGKSREVHGL